MKIKYYNRDKKSVEVEKVYGDSAISWLYDTPLGKRLWPVVSNRWASFVYGKFQDSKLSQFKVNPFIKKYGIDLDEYQRQCDDEAEIPFSSFNQFFIRKFKKEARPFCHETSIMPAFCEARYLGFNKIKENQLFPVKGKFLSEKMLLGGDKWSKFFDEGPLLIARLCPTDYHRFHFPDEGRILDQYPISGPLHSVNPLALKRKEDIFITNERYVSILETKNFGKLAYIEVGATCVGKIVQTHLAHNSFERGDEKGYFLFGGSTVIVLGQKGKWAPSEDILHYTQKSLEVWLKLGVEVASGT